MKYRVAPPAPVSDGMDDKNITNRLRLRSQVKDEPRSDGGGKVMERETVIITRSDSERLTDKKETERKDDAVSLSHIPSLSVHLIVFHL